MDQIGVKTEKLWPKENSGKTVNRRKHILNLLERNYAFIIGKRILGVRHGLRVNLQKIEGLFNKIAGTL